MKKTRLICIALIAVSPSIGRCEDAPRQSMKDGIRSYENKSYDRAAESFDRAAQAAQKDKLDASAAKYNAASARFRVGQFGAASTNFAEATHSPDLALQSKAYYNRGNALVSGSENAEKQGGLDTALGSMDEAIEMYENAMTLCPGDEDIKVNYELALKKKQELQKKQQEQQKQDQDKKDQQKEDQSQEQEKQKKDEQQKQDQHKNQQQDQKQDQQQNQGQPEPQQQTADQEKQPQPQKSEEMTPEEAKMMLDAMKQEEQASRDRMRLIIGQPTPVDKDW
jgi:Ca-activated chloride channel homolog